MIHRTTPRRDFSRHWAFTTRARALAKAGRRLVLLPEALPAPLFAMVLAGLAAAAGRGRWTWALGLWLFMLSDWVILAQLPRRRLSFGEPQAAALLLALPRALCGLLPVPAALALEIAGSVLAVYALWIEPHRIGVTRETLHSAKLSPGKPLRVMHLGDLHVERHTVREQQVIDLVAAERPDLIVCSGDLINYSYHEDHAAWADCRAVFERLAAPLGVFVVSGTHPGDGEASMISILDGTPARWLRDERVTVFHQGQGIDVIGLSCSHRPFLDRPRLEALLPPRRDRLTLLLYHTPDLAPDAAELGIDWMLCGHTHGGQVRLPWFGALATSSLYGKAFEMGRYALGGLTLYVTRGIGLEGAGAPRIRFLCPPEVTVWEVDGPGR